MRILSLFLVHLLASTTTASSLRAPQLNANALDSPSNVSYRLPTTSPAASQRALQWDDTFELSFTAHGESLTLSLSPTQNLIHDDGLSIQQGESHSILPRSKSLVFTGYILPSKHDYAHITLLDDRATAFQGTYSHRGETHTIHSTKTFLRTKRYNDPEPILTKRSAHADWDYGVMTVVRESEIAPHDEQLSTIRGFTDWALEASVPSSVRVKRQGDIGGGTSGMATNYASSIGSKNGCPTEKKVLYIGVAADCSYVAQFASADEARTQILTTFNTVSALYSNTFGVALALSSLIVSSPICPTTANSSEPWNVACPVPGAAGAININNRLNIFSAWRGADGRSTDGRGLWHLLTACATGSEVGVAWLGTMCQSTASSNSGSDQTTSGTAVTASTRSEWQVVAHEIGHNFGAIHDCEVSCNARGTARCCPFSNGATCDAGANFLMSPVASKPVSVFSPCSIGNVCSALGSSLNTTCLRSQGDLNNAQTVISLKSCGNGILEAGEDCDPGGADDPCCSAQCKFIAGAVCSPLNDACCTPTCQVAPSSLVCRPAMAGGCDLAETCDGTSPICPANKFVADGTSCAPSLSCASGVCTSRSQQCLVAGTSLGLSQGCSQRESPDCKIACVDPTSGGRGCVVLGGTFRDGSPCGYGGTCSNSVCQAGPPIKQFEEWFRSNLQISIPVTVLISLLIIAILFYIVRCCCCRRTKDMGNNRGKSGNSTSGAASTAFYRRPFSAAPTQYQNQSSQPPQNANYRPPSNFIYGPPQSNVNNLGSYPPPPTNVYRGAGEGAWVDSRAYNGR